MNSKTTKSQVTTTTPPATMTAVIQDEYGPADVLRVSEVERPTIKRDEVLVRVRAAGLDRGTWHLMTGLPYLVRLAGYGIRAPKHPIPGLDLAGTVVAVGRDVTRFVVGDEVFGIGQGSFAEYAAAPQDKLANMPANLPFEKAAVVPVSGMTALQGLRDAGRVQPDDHVLIIGASGGVGSFAVQIAKAFGAEVTGVASAAKADLVRELGADHVIDYTTEDFADGTRRYDLILDIGGNTPVSKLRSALANEGRLVIVGGESGGRWTGGIQRQIGATLLSPFVSQRLSMFISKETHVDIERLAELIENDQIVVAADTTYRLDQVPEAMRRLEAGEARGKIAVTVAAS